MKTRKGIAVQLETQLLKKLDSQDIPRNDIINKALQTFFTEDEKSESAFVKVENNEPTKEQTSVVTLTEDLYNEIYSNVYNTEIIPLKNQISLQRELIETLQYEVEEYKADKTFLKQHIKFLFEQPPKKLSRFNRKKREQEIKRLQGEE